MRAVVYGLALYMGTCSNPAQSLKIFSGLCSSSVTAALALITVITQLLLWDKLLSWKKYMDENQIHLIKSKMMAPRILDSEESQL